MAANRDGAAQTVTVVPVGLNFDTVNNMDIVSVPGNARSTPGNPPLGVQKVVRAVNGVHLAGDNGASTD